MRTTVLDHLHISDVECTFLAKGYIYIFSSPLSRQSGLIEINEMDEMSVGRMVKKREKPELQEEEEEEESSQAK